MNIIEVNNYQHMSQQAAKYIIEKVRSLPNIHLGLATGATPIGTYEALIEDHKYNRTSYRNIKTFNLDEYVGLSEENPNSYRFFMNDKLFNHIDINRANTHVPHGIAKDFSEECARYERIIEANGGIDLQILGIGSNGHIGFNEPGTSFHSKTHIVNLSQSTIEANSRFFNTLADVPTQAITMGISTIMKSKEILLLVSGESKSDALTTLLTTAVNESFPASILKNHPNVTIIADKAALAAGMLQ